MIKTKKITQSEAPKGLPEWVYKLPLYESSSRDSVVFYNDGDYWIILVGNTYATLAGWNTHG